MEKITIERYRLKGGYVIEIEESETMYNAWLYYEGVGVKSYIIGMDKDNPMGYGRDEFIDNMILDELKWSIYEYENDFMTDSTLEPKLYVDDEEIAKILKGKE